MSYLRILMWSECTCAVPFRCLTIEERILNAFFGELISKEVCLSDEMLTDKHHSQTNLTTINLLLSLTQLGGDSMSAMRLSNLINSHFSVEISAQAIIKLPLVEILQIICKALVGKQSHDVNHFTTSYEVSSVDWDKETSISFLEDIVLNKDSVPETITENDSDVVVLLTGATGFLGRFLLWELLCNKNVKKIYCLVRSLSGMHIHVYDICYRYLLYTFPGMSATSRVFSLVEVLSSEFECDNLKYTTKKIEVLESDLSKPRLGLSEQDYCTVQTDVELVIHNGAHVNHVLKYNG